MTEEKLTKWRLILGSESDDNNDAPLSGAFAEMDAALEALYDSDRKGGLGSSNPKVNRWLGDIRQYFPMSVVQVMMQDAMEKLDLKQLLLEPEILQTIEPDINLTATLISLNKVMPAKTRETARMVVKKVVEDLEKKLANPLREAIQGALSRSIRNRRPRLQEIDWKGTIRRNLKHYQHEYKTIIPQELVGYGRKGQALRDIVLCIDQSGSMASSVVYASVFGAVMASLRSVSVQMVLFDTAVSDVTKELTDPVELLFGAQLGGGTDINKALAYCQKLIRRPDDTIFVLISDLYEGGNQKEMLKRAAQIKSSGVQFISLLALDDNGSPMYDHSNAKTFGEMGIPTFACTPELFPDLMATAIKKQDLRQWAAKQEVVVR